jgi:hypothetical protein
LSKQHERRKIVKAQLHKLITRLAAHNAAKAKHHSELAKLHEQISEFHKGMDGQEDPATFHKDIAARHAAISSEHVEMGESCAECAKSFGATAKAAMGDDSLDLLAPLPEGLSTIHADAPLYKMVLRHGMAQPAPPNVPREFQKLVSVNDEEN